MTINRVWVHLADHEWGNELMEKVAMETFDAYPHLDPIVVEVYEHGGWYLTWARHDGRVFTVGTANDQWPGSQESKAFWRSVTDSKFVADIRRNKPITVFA